MGHISAPLDFVPRDHASWTHRFDDPERSYRTLYCAEQRETCFLEVFYSKRPDLTAIQEMADSYGCSLQEARQQAGAVSLEEILTRSIAPARIEVESGDVLDIEDLDLRSMLELEHLEELDISVLRGKNRVLTRKLSRTLFKQGAAGVVYGSRVVDSRCIALFEGRARLIPDGEPEPLKDRLDELRAVLERIDLTLPV
ncbi:MAG: RES family NAD+ phosphorylase [Thermoanaerobaculia bacterium]